MKLHRAVIIGRFCGLQTVEECILNIELHYLQCLPPADVGEECKELATEYLAYREGDLELDWKAIEAQVALDMKAYEADCAKQEEAEYNQITEVDLG